MKQLKWQICPYFISKFLCKVHDTCHQILIVFMAQFGGQISKAIAHEDIKLNQVPVPKIKFHIDPCGGGDNNIVKTKTRD